jgi:hypothetical protein
MEFTDLNDKKRTAKTFFVIEYDGEQFVETRVIGKNKNWVEWYPLEAFQSKNPMIMLMKKPDNVGEQI